MRIVFGDVKIGFITFDIGLTACVVIYERSPRKHRSHVGLLHSLQTSPNSKVATNWSQSYETFKSKKLRVNFTSFQKMYPMEPLFIESLVGITLKSLVKCEE